MLGGTNDIVEAKLLLVQVFNLSSIQAGELVERGVIPWYHCSALSTRAPSEAPSSTSFSMS